MIVLNNFGRFAVRPDVRIHETLERINSCGHQFQIVVDDGGRVSGAVTRKAVLDVLVNRDAGQ